MPILAQNDQKWTENKKMKQAIVNGKTKCQVRRTIKHKKAQKRTKKHRSAKTPDVTFFLLKMWGPDFDNFGSKWPKKD